MSRNKNQKGFSIAIIALAIVLILVLLVGSKVYKANVSVKSGDGAIIDFKFDLGSSINSYFLSIDPLTASGPASPIKANIESYDPGSIKISIKKDSALRECPELCAGPLVGSAVTLPNDLIQADSFKQARIIISGEGPDGAYILHKQNFQLSVQKDNKVLTKTTIYPTDVKHVFMYKQDAPSDACSYISNDQIKAGLRSAGLVPANDKYPGIDATTDKVLVIQKATTNKSLPLYTFPDGCQIKYNYI
jgi:hypothetical protein